VTVKTKHHNAAAHRKELADAINDSLIEATAGITAFATGGQASATQLTTEINEISTVATAADSVKLPSVAAGMVVRIINNGAEACAVFPFTSDNLGAGVNTSASLAAGAGITYAGYDSVNWRAV
jgi:hypothetical protein